MITMQDAAHSLNSVMAKMDEGEGSAAMLLNDPAPLRPFRFDHGVAQEAVGRNAAGIRRSTSSWTFSRLQPRKSRPGRTWRKQMNDQKKQDMIKIIKDAVMVEVKGQQLYTTRPARPRTRPPRPCSRCWPRMRTTTFAS